MIINHNMQGINANRMMGINQVSSGKNMEKLSSGLRINRAGDDAAGLSISEKMRGQIRGLNQASRNAQDGISMIQTAEGALNETHSILQRMRELSVQASNDSNVGQDREAIQGEIDQLTEEIDRIGNTTEFNKQSLLKGDGKTNLDATHLDLDTLSTKTAGTDATSKEVKVTADLGATLADTETLKVNLNGRELTLTFGNAGGSAVAGDVSAVSATGATIDLGGAANSVDDAAVSKATAEALQNLIDSDEDLKGNFKVSSSGGGAITIEALKDGDFAGSKGNINVTSSTPAQVTTQANTGVGGALAAYTSGTLLTGTDTPATSANTDIDLTSIAAQTDVDKLIGKGMTINGEQVEFYDADKGAYEGDTIGINLSNATNGTDVANAIVTQANGKIDGVSLSTDGAGELTVTDNDKGVSSEVKVSNGGVQEDFKAEFQIGANQGQTMEINIKDMGSDALGIKDLDLSTKEGAQKAITTVEAALTAVSTQRSDLGAFQNRLEHSINNLNTSSENLTAAESRIRDVDMAKEMMEMSKNNILNQASQAMLAQAKQAPQAVLQLLR